MQKKMNLYTVIPLGIGCVIAGILVGKQMHSDAGPAVDSCAVAAAVDDCCPVGDAHAEHESHDRGAVMEQDIDAIAQTACEHAVPIVECDECRYEAGVVKLEPAMAQSLIQTHTIDMQPRSTSIRLTGQVQLDPTRSVEISAAGSGRVGKIVKHLGQWVEKGELLAVLHSPELGQAKAEYLEAKAALELAEVTFKREKDLLDKQITSQADYQDAANQHKSAQAILAAAEKRLRLFGLDTEQIDAVHGEKENGEFANLALHAPQAGTVIAVNLSEGKIVDGADVLFTIADLSNVWVWCDVYENQLAVLHRRLASGEPLPANITVNAFRGETFVGMVDLAGHVMNEDTRTVKLRIQVQNADYKLRPGMFADAEILIAQPETVVAVPATAVMSDAGANFVFVQWKEDLWLRRNVSVGPKRGNFIEIENGLEPGQTVVSGGAFMLKSDILREKMGAGCAD